MLFKRFLFIFHFWIPDQVGDDEPKAVNKSKNSFLSAKGGIKVDGYGIKRTRNSSLVT